MENNQKNIPQLTNNTIRPWGHFQSLAQGSNYQIKHLFIKPYCRISLQKHLHRSEHWVVIDGIARILKRKKVFIIRENSYVYIPKGVTHRIENPQNKLLHIIEVQFGSYLG